MNIWEEGEGDAWWRRNRNALLQAQRAQSDPSLHLLDGRPAPRRVLEIGCANGWRLHAIQKRYPGCFCSGVDVSDEAIEDGEERYNLPDLYTAPAHHLPFEVNAFDLAIFAFVLHWVERVKLTQTVAEADRVLASNGYLIVTDFLPDAPTKVRYHHRTDVEPWTYKQDYARCFTALGTYQEVQRLLFNHDTGQPGDCAAHERAAAVLLRKQEQYVCASR